MADKLKSTAKRLEGISPTACGAKWYQATLHLFNGNTQSCHHVRPHRVTPEEIQKAAHALHNSDSKVRTRERMLKGVQVSECQYCWDIENTGGLSDRHIKSSEDWSFPFLNHMATETKRAIPTYLEVAFDNICNLKCMYCSPVYSSSWHREILNHGPYPTSRRFNNLIQPRIQGTNSLEESRADVYRNAFWRWWPEIKHKLHHLRITGGEPLLTRDTWHLLKELRSEHFDQLIFSINSNMMVPKRVFDRFTENILEIRKQVKKCILFCSIDSVGKKAEYLRHGLKEQVFYENLECLLQQSTSPLHISFMVTVSALSLSGLAELIEKIGQLKEKYPHHEIDLDTPYLRHPAHLSVLILPSEFDVYLDKALRALSRWGFSAQHQNKISRIKELQKEKAYKGLQGFRLRRDFKIMVGEHDRRRATDFKSTFPEYVDFLDSISNPKWLPVI